MRVPNNHHPVLDIDSEGGEIKIKKVHDGKRERKRSLT